MVQHDVPLSAAFRSPAKDRRIEPVGISRDTEAVSPRVRRNLRFPETSCS